MALDGIMTAALSAEFDSALKDARVLKIQQPESSTLLFQLRTKEGVKRLLLSANASLPYAAFTEEQKSGPEDAPAFLMLLRKHLNNARFISCSQLRFDRILAFSFEHLTELGDTERLTLILELMGRHSNLILTEENGLILDAIHRVPPTMSSVRTVLPGKTYAPADVKVKKDPLTEDRSAFLAALDPNKTLAEHLFSRYSGFSLSSASELVFSASLHPDTHLSELGKEETERYADAFFKYMDAVREGRFSPSLALGPRGEAEEFSAMDLPSYRAQGKTVRSFSSPSALILFALSERADRVLLKEHASGLKALIDTNLKRVLKKKELQEKQLRDTEGRDRDRLYGELLTAYQYQLENGQGKARVLDYYTNQEIEIPLDRTLTVSENAQRYFQRYQKQKRTAEALEKLIPETTLEEEHLKSILSEIALAEDRATLSGIRKELMESGYLRKSGKGNKKERIVSKPYHYLSSDGFHLYVGKNNLQNDELSLHFADKKDLFFHVKKAPGSHVILKTEGREVPDRSYQEAARLAVYYSSLRENGRAEVDYVEAGKLKKPAGQKPGFVVYYTNYSMIEDADISGLQRLE